MRLKPTGTRVTATDLETGESRTVVIQDNYVIICDGTCHIANTQLHANGTHQLTIKGRARANRTANYSGNHSGAPDA